jgi:type I restriction enzyme S subunit
MINWQQYNLKDITTKIGSGSTPSGGKESYFSSGITLVRSLNVYDFDFEYKGLAFINEAQAKKLKAVTVEKDDILLNITGASVGRCTMIPEKILPARVNQHVSIIRCNRTKADPKFLLYCINSSSYKDALMSIADSGATREALTKEDIEKFTVLLPSLPIQQRIASILSAYDDLIEINSQRIKLLEETARELYKEWFVRMRFPGYKKAKFVKGVPEGWEVKKLGGVIELAYGKALKEENRTEGEYPVYGSSGIVGTHDSFIAKAPGIVVGRKGNVGSVFWVTKNFYPIDTAFYIKTTLSLYYTYFNLLEQHFIEGDAAVPGLNRNQAYSNFILIPEDETLKKFDEVIKPVFDLLNNLIEQNIQLRQIRDRLLPRLISGKLQIKVAKEYQMNDEQLSIAAEP